MKFPTIKFNHFVALCYVTVRFKMIQENGLILCTKYKFNTNIPNLFYIVENKSALTFRCCLCIGLNCRLSGICGLCTGAG